MLRHAMLMDGDDVLVTAGTGYGMARVCCRLGAGRVIGVDVDSDLVKWGSAGIGQGGCRPYVAVCGMTEAPGR
jgi:predicted RNA methylase